MKKRLMLLLACFLVGVGLVTAQTQKVVGIVISEEDGQPVVGASVLVKETSNGTITDVDGNFTLFNVPNSARTLQVSYIGMQTQYVVIKPNLKIVLKSDTHMIDEVMIVAYGTAKKSHFTGSAATIKADDISSIQTSNATDVLVGQVAGVQVTKSSGQPGSGSSIRIRGIGSFSAGNEPLYVVDGIPYDGDISAINTQDIESMTVLKDAAANSLYGARGANGVIIVTTKRGNSNEARITLDAKWGTNRRAVPQYDVIENPATYYEVLYQSLYNGSYDSAIRGGATPDNAAITAHTTANSNIFTGTGGPGYQVYTVPEGQYFIGRNGRVNPNASLGYSDGEYYYTPDSWEKELLNNSNLRQEYNLNMSGGKDGLIYYASLGYLDDSGIIPGSAFTRYSARFKTDYQMKEWLKVGVNVSFTHYNAQIPEEQEANSSSMNIFYVANLMAPIYPLYIRNADGTIMKDNYGRTRYDYGDSKTSTNFDREFMSLSNPGSALQLEETMAKANVFGGQVYGDIDFLEGLKGRISFSYFSDDTKAHEMKTPFYGQYMEAGGVVSMAHSRIVTMNSQYMLTYKKEFLQNHHLDVLAGYEFYKLMIQSFGGGKLNMYNPSIPEIGNTINSPNIDSSTDTYVTLGFLGRLQYDYKEKYFVSGSYRRDASSRFYKDNRWGNFWSVGLGWVINKEDFMSDMDWIDLLKFKTSYGSQGNDNIGNYYAYVDQYKLANDNDNQAISLFYKANKDLTWETSYNFNIGVDFELFDRRLIGTIEYFNRQTEDMLYYKPIPSSMGYSQLPMNVGSVRNNGLEIGLDGIIYESRGLTWTASANATFLKNKILKLEPDLNGKWISDPYIYREGESMYQFYLKKYAGVDDKGDAVWYKDEKDNDGNVTGITTTTDWSSATKYEIGNDVLPKVYGGFGTQLKYKGFDFSVLFTYQMGGLIYDNTYSSLMHNGANGVGQNWHRDIFKAWTPENKDTNVPRMLYSSNAAMGIYTSDRFLTSSDYLSLQNISLGYTFPKMWTRKLLMESVRVYGVADNVALWAKRKGLDPRQSLTNGNNANYSIIRSISGGVTVTF